MAPGRSCAIVRTSRRWSFRSGSPARSPATAGESQGAGRPRPTARTGSTTSASPIRKSGNPKPQRQVLATESRPTLPTKRTAFHPAAHAAGSAAVVVSVAGLGAVFALEVSGGHAAVDQQCGPGDEGGLVAGVEHRRGGDVAGLADPADRRHRPAAAAFGRVRLAGRAHVPHAGPDV